MKQYILDVKKEVSRVRWPKKKEMINFSLVTLTFMIFFSAFFLLIDLLFTWLRTVGK